MLFTNSGTVSIQFFFSDDYMLKFFFLSTVKQGVFSRSQIFDDVSYMLPVEEVAKLGTSGLWLNIQVKMYIIFYIPFFIRSLLNLLLVTVLTAQ